MTASVFETFREQAWPYKYRGRIHTETLAGGVPTNPRVAEGWIRSKLQTTDQQIREMVSEAMVERGINPESGELDREQVIEQVAALKSLNGFKRTRQGQLYLEGRQLKAALKEAVGIAVSVGKVEQKNWGVTRKWLSKFLPEHVFVLEDKLLLEKPDGSPFTFDDLKPDSSIGGVNQRFVQTKMGARAIQYEEFVLGAEFDFTVASDYEFTDKDWAMLWLTGEMQGVGAARSAGFGRYVVMDWKRL